MTTEATTRPIQQRAPLRRPAVEQGTTPLSALAIDFGTSTSTATLFDNSEGDLQALRPAQAQALFRVLAELLRAPDWPTAQPGELDFPAAVAERVRERLANDPFPADHMELAVRLDQHAETEQKWRYTPPSRDDRGDRQDREAVLSATCLALEQLSYEQSEVLSGWLAPRLNRAYEEAFHQPSLASHYLRPLYLTAGALSVPSLLVVREHAGTVKGQLQYSKVEKADLGAFPGIKRYLNHPERVAQLEWAPIPRGWQPDTDLLLGLAYADLGEQVEKAAPKPEGADQPVMRRATITYPTTTPPGARRRLGELVREALSIEPDISYDEGTAAALFFVMRELGGAAASGIEALRAASRPRGGPRSWVRTMLVVDIGGGTTDIALIALELDEIRSQTDSSAGSSLFAGRQYRLRPRILGTSGHAQLGGDLLTLKVFYWIKSVIADRLLASEFAAGGENSAPDRKSLGQMWADAGATQPVPAALAPLVVGFRQADAAPFAVRSVLRTMLPTHLDTPPTGGGAASLPGSKAFEVLWRAAEAAKIQLARNEPAPIDLGFVHAIVEADPNHPWATVLSSLDRLDLTLSPHEFPGLVRPLLEDAMTLAGTLARSRLGAEEQAVLDVVALSGRTCGLAAARESAQAVLGHILLDQNGDGVPVRWDSTGIRVETELAKQAASIGACWASSRRDHNAVQHDQDLARGETVVDIQVDNLIVDLPCGFDLGAQEANSRRPLLAAGQRLNRSTADGTRYVESAWQPARREISVNRRIDGPNHPFIRWGHFDFADRARLEADQPGGSEWSPHVLDLSPDVWFSVRLDQGLTPTLLLRRSTAAVVAVDSPLSEMRLPAEVFEHGTLPLIEVELRLDHDEPVVATLFTPEARFDHLFAALVGHPRTVRGAIGAAPFPIPPPHFGRDTGSYQLRVRYDGNVEPLGEPITLAVRAKPGAAGAAYWATLDEEGCLRVLAGYPLYPTVSTLAEMQQAPGCVYETRMNDVRNARDPWRDPFTGGH
jgi:hypothetical protein